MVIGYAEDFTVLKSIGILFAFLGVFLVSSAYRLLSGVVATCSTRNQIASELGITVVGAWQVRDAEVMIDRVRELVEGEDNSK